MVLYILDALRDIKASVRYVHTFEQHFSDIYRSQSIQTGTAITIDQLQ